MEGGVVMSSGKSTGTRLDYVSQKDRETIRQKRFYKLISKNKVHFDWLKRDRRVTQYLINPEGNQLQQGVSYTFAMTNFHSINHTKGQKDKKREYIEAVVMSFYNDLIIAPEEIDRMSKHMTDGAKAINFAGRPQAPYLLSVKKFEVNEDGEIGEIFFQNRWFHKTLDSLFGSEVFKEMVNGQYDSIAHPQIDKYRQQIEEEARQIEETNQLEQERTQRLIDKLLAYYQADKADQEIHSPFTIEVDSRSQENELKSDGNNAVAVEESDAQEPYVEPLENNEADDEELVQNKIETTDKHEFKEDLVQFDTKETEEPPFDIRPIEKKRSKPTTITHHLDKQEQWLSQQRNAVKEEQAESEPSKQDVQQEPEVDSGDIEIDLEAILAQEAELLESSDSEFAPDEFDLEPEEFEDFDDIGPGFD